MLKLYREHKRIVQDLNPEHKKQRLEFAEKSFSNGATTLVALLVLNERKADAERIAADAVKEWDDPDFKKQLEKAKKGNVPLPWP